METMHKVKAGIMQVLGFVIIALFAFMTLIGTYQIVTRYFFNRPSTVSEELLTYAFTWMALLASAYVFGKRDHMRMGFLADKLIGAPRKYLEITIDLLTFLLAAVVMVYGGISITKLTMIESALHALVTPVNKEEKPKEITHSVNDLLDHLIEESVALVGKPVALMNKEDKVTAIQFLNDSGAFLITKSGDKVANYFGISKYTLYSYIDVNK